MTPRRCPRCRQLKDYHPDTGGDFYVQKYKVRGTWGSEHTVWLEESAPSSLCRKCDTKRRIRDRKDQRTREGLLKTAAAEFVAQEGFAAGFEGRCSFCGIEGTMNMTLRPRVTAACAIDFALVGTGKMADRERLKKALGLLLKHNQKERELELRDEGARGMHQGNKFGKFEDHHLCVEMEDRVKKVLGWMVKR